MAPQDPAKVIVLPNAVEQLKDAAWKAENLRARICLHADTSDPVQEMLIALCAGTKVSIHRHPNKTESFHMVEGELDVIFFDNDGKETERLRLGAPASGHPFMYRLNSPLWHSVEPITNVAVVHEVITGPFNTSSNEFLDADQRPKTLQLNTMEF